MPTILSRLRGLVRPSTPDQPLRLADGGGGGGGGSSSPLTTKGDIWGYDTADDRIPVGTDGDVLTADSTAALGVSYQTPAAGGSITVTDGSTTVTGTTEILVSGGVVSEPSAGIAEITIGGGGGGGGSGVSDAITLSGTTTAIDASVASLYLVNLTADTSVSLTGATAGDDTELRLVILQGGGSASTLTWTSPIAWPGGIAPTLTTALGESDIIDLRSADGTNWYGYLVATGLFQPAGPSSYDTTILADNPVGYWKMNESTGTSAIDYGPNGLTGTYFGTPGSQYSLGNAKIAAGLDLSAYIGIGGAGSYMEVPHNSLFDFNSGDWSMEMWVSPTGLSSYEEAFTKGQYAYRFVFSGGNMEIWQNNSLLFSSVANATNGSPYHYVLTADRTLGVTKLYINGALDSSTTSAPTFTDTTATIRLGNLIGVGQQYVGYMSNCAVYASALSAVRVAAHYAAGI